MSASWEASFSASSLFCAAAFLSLVLEFPDAGLQPARLGVRKFRTYLEERVPGEALLEDPNREFAFGRLEGPENGALAVKLEVVAPEGNLRCAGEAVQKTAQQILGVRIGAGGFPDQGMGGFLTAHKFQTTEGAGRDVLGVTRFRYHHAVFVHQGADGGGGFLVKIPSAQSFGFADGITAQHRAKGVADPGPGQGGFGPGAFGGIVVIAVF